MTCCIILQELAIREFLHFYHRWTWYTATGYVVLLHLKCAKKTYPHHHLKLFIKGKTDSCFVCTIYLNYTVESKNSSDQESSFQSNFVHVSWNGENCTLSFLFYAERCGACCVVFPAVTICFKIQRVLRDCIPHTLFGMTAYLSCSCLLSRTRLFILLLPPTPTNHFCTSNCCSLDVFFFLHHFV